MLFRTTTIAAPTLATAVADDDDDATAIAITAVTTNYYT